MNDSVLRVSTPLVTECGAEAAAPAASARSGADAAAAAAVARPSTGSGRPANVAADVLGGCEAVAAGAAACATGLADARVVLAELAAKCCTDALGGVAPLDTRAWVSGVTLAAGAIAGAVADGSVLGGS